MNTSMRCDPDFLAVWNLVSIMETGREVAGCSPDPPTKDACPPRVLFGVPRARPIGETKTIVLIRHGESLGQVAPREARRNDQNLVDCKLTFKGERQAQSLKSRLIEAGVKSLDLVVSSPLSRALQTTLLAFHGTPILIAYDLREVGSMIPENIPRPISEVLKDLVKSDSEKLLIDTTTLQPEKWPRRHDTPPKVIRRDKIRQFFKWLVSRPEKTIAVVCHYHVIRSALSPPSNAMRSNLKPENCAPILCELDEHGSLAQLDTDWTERD